MSSYADLDTLPEGLPDLPVLRRFESDWGLVSVLEEADDYYAVYLEASLIGHVERVNRNLGHSIAQHYRPIASKTYYRTIQKAAEAAFARYLKEPG